jgi:hypothetical protein
MSSQCTAQARRGGEMHRSKAGLKPPHRLAEPICETDMVDSIPTLHFAFENKLA